MQRNQNNRKVKSKKQKKTFRGRETLTSVPSRTPGIADSSIVFLRFRTDFRLYGSNPIAVRWVTNGAFDADPLLGGLKYEYFDVWSQFYSYNKVLSYKIDLHLSNVDVVPVNVVLCHTNTDPGVTGVSYPGYALQPYGYSTTLSGYSGGSCNLHYTKKLSVRHVVGDKLVTTSERFTGSDTANPADLTYFGIGVRDQITSLANGLVGTYIATIKVKFFDRKKLDDTTFASSWAQKNTGPVPSYVGVQPSAVNQLARKN